MALVQTHHHNHCMCSYITPELSQSLKIYHIIIIMIVRLHSFTQPNHFKKGLVARSVQSCAATLSGFIIGSYQHL